MDYSNVVKFAYITNYLTKHTSIGFNGFNYFNSLFCLESNPDNLFVDFIGFLNEKGYANREWCISFRKFWDLNNDRKYVEIFRKYSKLSNESIFLIFTHFCSEVLNKRIPEHETSMIFLLDKWIKTYGNEVAYEYKFIFGNSMNDYLLVENLPTINLSMPKVDNKEKIIELIYALEEINTDEISKTLIDKLKNELSIECGINFNN